MRAKTGFVVVSANALPPRSRLGEGAGLDLTVVTSRLLSHHFRALKINRNLHIDERSTTSDYTLMMKRCQSEELDFQTINYCRLSMKRRCAGQKESSRMENRNPSIVYEQKRSKFPHSCGLTSIQHHTGSSVNTDACAH